MTASLKKSLLATVLFATTGTLSAMPAPVHSEDSNYKPVQASLLPFLGQEALDGAMSCRSLTG